MSRAQLLTVAVVGLLFGPPLALWPYEMARLSEVLDSIGRKPAGPVEPADWMVFVTRVFGVCLAVAGSVSAVLLFV